MKGKNKMTDKTEKKSRIERVLRPIAFSTMGVIVVLLIAATIVEQRAGTAIAVKYIYTAPWTIALWAIAAISGIAYMLTQRLWANIFTALLHFSFVVILAGAMVTHLFGEAGTIHLRMDEGDGASTYLTTEKGEESSLPFSLELSDFHIDYYPGTLAPMDFVSEVSIVDNGKTERGEVSMNKVLRYKNYRFYQSMYDSDGKGVTFRVSHDPWGIGITYAGYALLLLSMIGFFFQRRTHFRALLHSPLIRTTAVVVMLLAVVMPAEASGKSTPPTVSESAAEEFGNLYVYYNDRVCPMQTLAKEFTQKLYGKEEYKGLTAEQVLCGWLFFYDKWAAEPMIKVKGDEVRQTLGNGKKYVCLNDYFGRGQYKLEPLLRKNDKQAKAADEKFQLVSMVCTGTLMKIYPIGERQHWYSWVDQLPTDISHEDFQFVKRSMEYVALCVAKNDMEDMRTSLQKIRAWQAEKAKVLPTATRFGAEKAYNSFGYTRPMAMTCTTIGLLLYLVLCFMMARGKRPSRYTLITFTVLMGAVWVLLTIGLVLRWIVSAHIPLSNGHETMQFLAWLSALLTTIIGVHNLYGSKQRLDLVLPIGWLLTGLTLMVSMMSGSNPQITNLMPVLQSPWLSIHVAIIMVAYCLLFFVMMNGITALINTAFGKQPKRQKKALSKRLQVTSQILLYPAVFCLTIGIFVGAVWANQSWGRYWGWDPKEVWALVTMLVYSLLFHTRSIPQLRKPTIFHAYTIVAFLAVLFTYFGVNFLLGGMHAYN